MTDRTTLDELIYSGMHGTPTAEYERAALRAHGAVHPRLLLPFNAFCDLGDDPKRNHSMDYQREFDARLAERIVSLEVASVVGVWTLDDADLDKRKNFISGSARAADGGAVRSLPILTAPVLATAQCNGCGKCCKVCWGSSVPEDFGNDLSRMREAIAAGRVAIDWWEGERVYHRVRPRRRCRARCSIRRGGECNYLTATGCELTYEARPRQCRGLVPGEPGVRNCIEPGAEKYDFVARVVGVADRVLDGRRHRRERRAA